MKCYFYIVCHRRKAFNAYELLLLVAERFEDLFRERLLDVALKRRKALHDFSQGTSRITSEMVSHAEAANTYEVDSESVVDHKYIVDASIARCSCASGIGGKFCKHIAAVERFFPDSICVNRMVSPSERFQVALLAAGREEVPNPTFFGCSENEANQLLREAVSIFACSSDQATAVEDEPDSDVELPDSSDDFEEDKMSDKAVVGIIEAAGQQFKSMLLDHRSDPNVMSGVLAMQRNLSKLSNSNALATALHNFGKNCSAAGGKSSRRISVQPTGISRRGEGQPRGASALTKGRPRKRKAGEARLVCVPHKRRRLLALNVELNQPNSKSHGTGH